MTPLPVVPAHRLAERAEDQRWLVTDLWSEQAVGIIDGEPKCRKTFLALDLAVAAATGRPRRRRFAVPTRTRAALCRRGRPAHRPSPARRHPRRRRGRSRRHRRPGHHRTQPAPRSRSRSGETRADRRQVEASNARPRSVRPPEKVRKQEYAHLTGDERKFITGQKYVLPSRRTNLSPEGKQSLRLLLAATSG